MGVCVYHIAHQSMSQWFRQIGRNAEMVNYTQGVYDAREIAMERLYAEATALQAAPVVGVNISQDNYEWESHVIEFFVLGTAIVPFSSDHPLPKPTLTLPLNS